MHFIYLIEHLFTGMNSNNPLWSNTVETAGDKASDHPRDSMKRQMNCYRWLPSQRLPILISARIDAHRTSRSSFPNR